MANVLLERFLDPDPDTGVGALHLVYTRFKTVMSQVPEVRQMLPLTVVDAPESDEERATERGFADDPSLAQPEYEFSIDTTTGISAPPMERLNASRIPAQWRSLSAMPALAGRPLSVRTNTISSRKETIRAAGSFCDGLAASTV